jgi:hypothetical protein
VKGQRHSYLDREVVVQTGTENEPALRSSTVLLVAQAGIDVELLGAAVDALVRARPLALLLGLDAARVFDHLLLSLSLRPDAPHIMTSTCDGTIEDCIATLLTATWPSDERFDDWKFYRIIPLGRDGFTAQVSAVIESLCRR